MKIEDIEEKGVLLAQILSNLSNKTTTEFATNPQHILQVGTIEVNEKRSIPRHRHQQTKRSISGTSEVLIVIKGEVVANIFSQFTTDLIATRKLLVGMVIVLHTGGHSFESIEDSVLLEIKNGPYSESLDKVFF